MRKPLLLAALALVISATAVLLLPSADEGVRLEGNELAVEPPTRLVWAKDVARVIWGDVCDGDVAVTVAPLDGHQAGRAGWLQWPDDHRSDCTVVVDQRKWSERDFCAVVVHEYGHLAGREHSSDPDSVMYPRLSDRNVPERCKEKR